MSDKWHPHRTSPIAVPPFFFLPLHTNLTSPTRVRLRPPSSFFQFVHPTLYHLVPLSSLLSHLSSVPSPPVPPLLPPAFSSTHYTPESSLCFISPHLPSHPRLNELTGSSTNWPWQTLSATTLSAENKVRKRTKQTSTAVDFFICNRLCPSNSGLFNYNFL